MNIRLATAASTLFCVATLTACSGAGSATGAIPSQTDGSQSKLAQATFKLTIPRQSTASSTSRKPLYVAPSTLSVKFSLLTVNGGAPPAGLSPLTVNVTTSSNGCTTTASATTCVIAYHVPVGSDQIEIQTYDGNNAAGNLLSQQIKTFTIAVGIDNSLSVTLDANPSTIAVNPPGTGITGSVGSGFVLNGSSAVTFSVTLSDTHGTPIGGTVAGAPTLSATSSNPAVATVSTNSGAQTLTVTPGGSNGSTTITLVANPAASGDGLASSQLQFTVSTQPTLIAAGEAGTTTGQVNLFTLSGATFVPFGTIPSSVLGTYTPAALGMDTTNKLYLFDNNSNVILEFPFSELSQSSGQTFTTISNGITGNSGSGLYPTFALAPDGTMAVGNSASSTTLNQLAVFNPGATSPSLTRAFGGPQAGYFYRAGASAVLTNTSGVPFAYAVALESDNGTANSNITSTAFGAAKVGVIATSAGAISGSTSSSCNVTCYEYDLVNEPGGPIGALDIFPGLVWNNHNQELVLFDNTNGRIVAYPFVSGAFGTPVQIDTYTSTDISSILAYYAISRDGHLAVTYGDINGNTYMNVYDSTHTKVASWTFAYNGTNGFTVFGLAFLPNNTLIVAGGYNSSPNQLFAYNLVSNSAAIATVNLAQPVSSAASSGQSSRRKPDVTRRALHASVFH
jgi:hypothetical protein